jgi:hypothetical protein
MGKSKLTKFLAAFWGLFRSAPSRSIGWKSKLLRCTFVLWCALMIDSILYHRLEEASFFFCFALVCLTLLLFIADLWLAAKATSS